MSVRIITGDCRNVLGTLPDESVHCVVTSPPYWGLRDYGTAQWEGGDPECDHKSNRTGSGLMADEMRQRGEDRGYAKGSNFANYGSRWTDGSVYRDQCAKCGACRIDSQIGLEATLDEYVEIMVAVFREVRRVLRRDGTCWINLGDGFKDKQLLGAPWRVAFALQADGWWLRQDIIFSKKNPMPESVTDRCTKSHEYLFLLSKSANYYFDNEAIREEAIRGRQIGNFRDGSYTSGNAFNNSEIVAEKYSGTHYDITAGRNRRSVWEIATAPFSDWAQTVHRVRVAADAPDDGKKRITSPDCPLHGDQCQSFSKVSGGEHEGMNPSHTQCSENRPDQAPHSGSLPTEMRREPETDQRNLDLHAPSYSASAKHHSSQTHKTGRAPETSSACTASVQIPFHTLDTSKSHEPSGLVARMRESNNGVGEMGDNRASQMFGHSARTSGEPALISALHGSNCTCEWYIEKTEKASHFATFPPALVEPCIKAGTSEKGCCAKCGAPWVRQLGESPGGKRSWHDHSNDSTAGMSQCKHGQKTWDSYSPPPTLGWSPSCSCIAWNGPGITTGVPDSVPCTVLDPFGGSGTTGMVADRLGRDAILIELNPQYAAMAERRVARMGPDERSRESVKAQGLPYDPGPLFAGLPDQER